MFSFQTAKVITFWWIFVFFLTFQHFSTGWLPYFRKLFLRLLKLPFMRPLSLVLDHVFLGHLGHESPLNPLLKFLVKKQFASEIALHKSWQLHENDGVLSKSFQQPSKLIKLFGILLLLPRWQDFSWMQIELLLKHLCVGILSKKTIANQGENQGTSSKIALDCFSNSDKDDKMNQICIPGIQMER